MKNGPEIYNNTVCPVCKKTVKEVRTWANCRKNKASACMDHCYKGCEHMNNHKCYYLRDIKEK